MMHTNLDLNLLSTLQTLLEERNVSGSARRLGISQSAMSHRLKRLRETLGDPLFVNGPQGLVPTERARALEQPLRDALARIVIAVRAVEPFDPATSQRRFVVAGSDYGEFVMVPDLMARIQQAAPHVEIVLDGVRPDVGRLLEEGQVDLVVGPQLAARSGLMTRKLGEHTFVVVHRKAHPLAAQRLTLDRYARGRHVLVAPQGGDSSAVDAALRARGRRRHIALTTRHFATAPFIVARSDLLWTAPREIALAGAEYVELVVRAPPLPLQCFGYFLSWHERVQADPAHRWLRQLILDAGPDRRRS